MSYEDRIAEVKQAFQKNDMKEERFWQLVRKADWPNRGYDVPKREFLTTLSAEEGKKFRMVADRLWNILDKFIGERNPAGGSDDSHSDFIYHIIGLGRIEFYDSLENYTVMKNRGKAGDYEESFGYCIPYVSDWDNPEEEIASLDKSIKRHGEKEAGVVHKYFHDIIGDIEEVLSEADGEFVAEVYNKICSEQIEYVEDSLWQVKETA